MGFLNRTGAEIGWQIDKKCEKSFFIVEKIEKYRKGPALQLSMWCEPLCVASKNLVNPSVPDAHYSERQDKPFSLQVQRWVFDLRLNCGFLFVHPGQ